MVEILQNLLHRPYKLICPQLVKLTKHYCYYVVKWHQSYSCHINLLIFFLEGDDKTITNFTTKRLQIDVKKNVIGSTSTIKMSI